MHYGGFRTLYYCPVPWSETLPQFSVAGTLLTVLLLLFAAVGEPLLGRKAFAWLSRRRGGDARALTQVHAVTMAVHVLWGLVVLGVLLLSPDLLPSDLGLRLPDAWGPVVGGAVGGLAALAALWVLVNGLPANLPRPGSLAPGKGRRGGGGRRATGHRGRRASAAPMTLPEPERDRGLLVPRTTRERAVAAGVAVTGGVFGELLYRGLFIALVAGTGVPLWAAAVLSVVLFSVAHLYQGWWGLVSAGTSGTLFTVLYLGTGSIWVPILVHVALDLRSLAFPPPAVREEGERLHEDYDDAYDDGYDDYEDAGYDDGYDGYDGYEDRPAAGDTGAMPPVDDGSPAPADGFPGTAPPARGGTPAHGTRALGEAPPQDLRSGGSAPDRPGSGVPPFRGGAGGTAMDSGTAGGPLGYDTPGGGAPAFGGTPSQGGPSWSGPAQSAPWDGPGQGVTPQNDPRYGSPSRQGWDGQDDGLPSGGQDFGRAPVAPPSQGAHGGPPFQGGAGGSVVDSGPYGGPPAYGAPTWDGPEATGTPDPGAPSWGPAPGYGHAPGYDPAPPGYGAGHGPSHAAPPPQGPDPYGDTGDVLGGPPQTPPNGGRRLYPDEWIDHRYGDGGDTPGPGPAPGR